MHVISKIERSVRNGGLFALAMPRGSGKTVACQTAVIWAALSGATPFVCLIAASADRAQNLLENIKTWLETNILLQEDFPEVCYPIQCLERIANRQKGQKFLGEEMLTVGEICEKTNGYSRAVIPASCSHLTMFTDVHQNALYWMMVA